jgi:hypothetical protein
MNFAVRTPTVTATQSYSLVIRDIFFDAVKRMPFFQGFTARKSKYYQVQPENIPYLGIYIINEDMVPDGDANAGNIGFIHTLRLGFSVVIQNNDPEVSELKMDQAFWAIMNGLWTDQYICNMLDTQAYGHPEQALPNPDNVRFEGIPRATRRHMYGDNKLTNEMPYCELQYDVSVLYRTDFAPVITDTLDHLHIEMVPMSKAGDVPSAEEVERVEAVWDLTSDPSPETP